MKKIVEKRLPDHIFDKLAYTRKEEEFRTYYIINDDIYIHTQFYVDEEEPNLTLLHDMAFVEGEMIKDMKAKKKIWLDKDKRPFFDLYHLALWFFERIPSKDWMDLLSFLRIIKEYEKMNNFIKFDEPKEELATH